VPVADETLDESELCRRLEVELAPEPRGDGAAKPCTRRMGEEGAVVVPAEVCDWTRGDGREVGTVEGDPEDLRLMAGGRATPEGPAVGPAVEGAGAGVRSSSIERETRLTLGRGRLRAPHQSWLAGARGRDAGLRTVWL
jgi:hypothetical protein